MTRVEEKRAQSPWAFVPTLYVLQGIPYWAVDTATTAFFQQIGVRLSDIGAWSSQLALPWTLKPLWSPLVDFVGTKRGWTLGVQAALAALLAVLAFVASSAHPLAAVVVACAAIAIASATCDIAADGYYLIALEKREQELFVGVRNAFYRLGRVLSSGGVLFVVGASQKQFGLDVHASWAAGFGACAALYALLATWNAFTLPRPARDGPARSRSERVPLRAAVASYFVRPRILGILAFIFFYRFAESLLTKMISPFLLQSREVGGLGLAADDLGLVYSTIGVVALLAGGIIGGAFVARRGLRRSIWPMALAMHAPNLLYVWMAHAQPHIGWVSVVVAIEQFGYGFGFSAYMVFLMQISRGSRFATTHYAISTGLMGAAALLAGNWSGTLAENLGWERFMWVVVCASVPGLGAIVAAPLVEVAPSAGVPIERAR